MAQRYDADMFGPSNGRVATLTRRIESHFIVSEIELDVRTTKKIDAECPDDRPGRSIRGRNIRVVVGTWVNHQIVGWQLQCADCKMGHADECLD